MSTMSSTHPLLMEGPLGDPRRWARDFAVVTSGTSAALWFVCAPVAPPAGVPVIAVLGLLAGGMLGLLMPRVVARFEGAYRVGLIPLALLAMGGIAGALMGLVAGLVVGQGSAVLGLVAGGLSGALQLVVFGLPYLWCRRRGRAVWPALLLSAMALPVLYFFMFFGTMVIIIGAIGMNV